ncbi:hypothetical protein Y032_0041g411 [Ancylostoma ceylanicum]|uniref:Uncharacterized protein n=1 Tax=Ancylostoma ceylanicum TaxID=53326 RepID=A0A016UHX8_9BILA|nr:hypothetical protein Y032_0041g411 [Ancylostoma ceylanicum]
MRVGMFQTGGGKRRTGDRMDGWMELGPTGEEWPTWCEERAILKQCERSGHHEKPRSPALAGRSGWYTIKYRPFATT